MKKLRLPRVSLASATAPATSSRPALVALEPDDLTAITGGIGVVAQLAPASPTTAGTTGSAPPVG